MREVITTEKGPKAIGPYSQAIKANGFIFISGQTAFDPATGKALDGDAAQQTERIFQNLIAIVEAAGSSLDRAVRLGDEVFMLLNLMGEEEKLPVAGRVIWMTPKGAQGKRTAGIGVQFSDQDRGNTQKKIENYLAGALGGDKPTHTM